ncbi:hypothetical protein ACU686_41965 [Yinghuangia aomiensis]
MQQVAADAAEGARVQDDLGAAVPDPQFARRTGRRVVDGAAQQRHHRGGALEPGHGRTVVVVRGGAVDEVAEGVQDGAAFAERREDAFDVGGEPRVGADHEDAARAEPLAVPEQQVGDAVQGDGGFAGAGAAADDHRAVGGGADRVVLLLLDGGDDVAHAAVAGAAERGEERAVADHDQVVGGVLGVEEVVFDVDDLVAAAVQDAAAHDLPRVLRGGLVEGLGGGGAPVDDEDLAVLVADADAADVPHVAGVQVEAPEDEAVVGGVEGARPQFGAEDHGVAFHERAHGADLGLLVALAHEGLRFAAHGVEPLVGAVDVPLLGVDLALLDVRGGIRGGGGGGRLRRGRRGRRIRRGRAGRLLPG